MITKEKLDEIHNKYLTGRKIRLNEMKDEPQMPAGLIGEITYVDDIGQIHIKWNNGSSLALLPDEDSFEEYVVKEKENG